MSISLTPADVTRLLKDRSPESRTVTAEKVAAQYGASSLTEGERALAEAIFRVMVRDAEVRVREALSVHLKESPLVPNDIALSLAKDVDSVALPILRYSEVLSDADLIEIVRSQQPSKQIAIAGRRAVSAEVADALVDTENTEAVAILVSNDGADLSEKSLEKVVRNYGGEERIQTGLVHRASLPVTVVERLIAMVSESLREELLSRECLQDGVITDVMTQVRERATVGLATDYEDVQRLVMHLRANNRLTPSFILRALCTGQLVLFDECISQLAGIPIVNARQLIYDQGALGFKAVYEKTGLPAGLFAAFEVAVRVAMETEYDGSDRDRERYVRRMIERILTQFEAMGADNLEYLMARLNQMTGSVAALH